MEDVSWVKIMLVRESGRPECRLRSPEEVHEFFKEYYKHHDREECIAIMLDAKNQPLALHTVSIGSIDQAICIPRDVFKAAILANAVSVIMVHNHPSGDPTPSKEDGIWSQRMAQAGEILGIPVLDVVIIGDERHVSLREKGQIRPKNSF